MGQIAHRIAPVIAAACLASVAWPARAQQTRDSAATRLATPVWRDSVRYGEGPSVGAPRSDFTGAAPPATWCLEDTRRATGDFGSTGRSWIEISQGRLRQMLTDTTDFGAGWRKVLGGAPQITPSDSITRVTDEETCRDVAEVINRDILGWRVGPPPVVVLRVRDFLVAYPSNARLGEFGMAVGMNLQHQTRGAATW